MRVGTMREKSPGRTVHTQSGWQKRLHNLIGSGENVYGVIKSFFKKMYYGVINYYFKRKNT